MKLTIPAILLSAIAVSAGTCTQEERAQAITACAVARVALDVAENHDADPADLVRYRKDVALVCAALTPPEVAEANAAVSAAVAP